MDALTRAILTAIPVREWWDVFTFTGDNQLQCPDCETVSPSFRDIYRAVKWVNDHYAKCRIKDHG